MPTKKHILFLVPDGVGIKNFLYSDIIKYLKEEVIFTIWSPLPMDAFDDVKKLHQIDFYYKQIQLKPENSSTRLYREATTYARLIYNTQRQNNPTILTNWRPSKYSLKVKLLYAAAEVLGKYLSKNYKRILKFEKKAIASISQTLVNAYKDDLKALNLNSLFITHQRVAGLMPICIAAKQLDIKSTTAIFSWDNLPKARLAVKTDLYLVWSQWMCNEMADYYSEIPKSDVKLVGTPQFEFYMDEKRLESRKEFASAYGLDVNKKWICFSGDDVITSPYDHLFLNDVAEALIAENEEIQIIFRRCPVDFSNRYDSTLSKYKNFIVSIDPIWNVEAETGWAGYFPKYEDINLQVNLSHHCHLVVNLGSTMALDFAINNKPCLYLNYNPSADVDWSTEIIYNFQHFRSMKDLDAVGWINRKDDILDCIMKALNHPDKIGSERKLWMQNLVLHPIDENALKIAKTIV